MSLSTLPRPDTALTERAGGGLLELIADVAPDGRTYLSRRSQRFPLRLTTPLYLDPSQPGMAFLYVQNPTGGLFEDDDHKIALDVRSGAQVHLTTQSASKLYRADRGCARQRVTLAVAKGAFAEYVPDPLIPHGGARLKQEVVAAVEPGGRLILSEVVAPGRVAGGEQFEYSSAVVDNSDLERGCEQTAVDSVLLEPGRLDPRRAGVLGDRGLSGIGLRGRPRSGLRSARQDDLRGSGRHAGMPRRDQHPALGDGGPHAHPRGLRNLRGPGIRRRVVGSSHRPDRKRSPQETKVTLLIREIVGEADDAGFVGRRRDPLPVASDEARRRRFGDVSRRGAGASHSICHADPSCTSARCSTTMARRSSWSSVPWSRPSWCASTPRCLPS